MPSEGMCVLFKPSVCVKESTQFELECQDSGLLKKKLCMTFVKMVKQALYRTIATGFWTKGQRVSSILNTTRESGHLQPKNRVG